MARLIIKESAQDVLHPTNRVCVVSIDCLYSFGKVCDGAYTPSLPMLHGDISPCRADGGSLRSSWIRRLEEKEHVMFAEKALINSPRTVYVTKMKP